jgi:stage V sporulation protein B
MTAPLSTISAAPRPESVVRHTINTLWASGLYFAAVTVSGLLIARMLGVHGRGQASAVTLIPLLIAYAGELGIPVATGYLLGSGISEPARVKGTARLLGIYLSVTLTVIGVCVVVIAPIQPRLRLLTMAFCLFISLNIFQRIGLAILQAELRMKLFNRVRIAGAATYLLAIVGLYLTKTGTPTTAVGAILLGNLVWAVYAMVLTWSPPSLLADRVLRRAIMSYGIRAHLGNINSVETLNLDQIVLAIFLPVSQLGLYVAAISVVTANRIIGISTGMVAFPVAANERQTLGTTVSARRSGPSVLLSTTLGLSILVAGSEVVFASQILSIGFGQGFAAGTAALRILAVASVAMNMRQVGSDWIRGKGKPEITTMAEVVSLVSLSLLAWRFWDGTIVAIAWSVLLSSVLALASLGLAYSYTLWTEKGFRARATSTRSEVPKLTRTVPIVTRLALTQRTKSTQKRSDNARTVVVVLALGLPAGIAIALTSKAGNGGTTLCAAILFSLPIVVRAVQRRLSFLDPIVVVAVAFLLMFAVRPAWHLTSGHYTYLGYSVVPGFTKAIHIAIVGFLGLLVGYSGSGWRRRNPAEPRTRVLVYPKRLLHASILMLLGAAGALLLFLKVSGLSLGSYASGRSFAQASIVNSSTAYLYFAPYVAIPIALLLLTFRPSLPSYLARAAIGGGVALVLVNALLRGNRIWLLPLIAGLLIVKARASSRRLFLYVMVFAVPLLILGASLRQSRFRESGVSLGSAVGQFARAPGNALGSTISSGDLAMFDSLSIEAANVPRPIPNHHGVVVTSIIGRSIPKLLWPGKPDAADEFLNRTFFPANAGKSQYLPTYSALGEAYLDWGLFGVFMVMLIAGILARRIYGWYLSRAADPLSRLVYAMALVLLVIYLRGSAADTAGRALFLVGPLLLIPRVTGMQYRRAATTAQRAADTGHLPTMALPRV